MTFTFTTLILVLLIIISVALLLGELFYIPGFGLPGVLGILGVAGVATYLYLNGEIWMMAFMLILAVIVFFVGFYFLSRSKVMNKISLSKEIDEKTNELPTTLYVGARGIAKSRLALTGRVEIDGQIFEATSEQGFILEDTPIYISRMAKDKVFVSMDKTELNEHNQL